MSLKSETGKNRGSESVDTATNATRPTSGALGQMPIFSEKMYDAQRLAFYPSGSFEAAKNPRFKLIEASTKAGKSVGALLWICDMMGPYGVGGRDRDFTWLSPVYSQARVMYRRAIAAFRDAKWIAHKNDSEMTITNVLGSRLTFKSAERPDSIFGNDAFAIVYDESTRMTEAAFFAGRSTLTATSSIPGGGQGVLIGNVQGRRNWFYQLCRRAELGADEDLSYSKLTAYDAVIGGIITEAEIESARKMLPDQVFRELYLAEPSEDQGNPFGFEYIRKCTIESMSTKPVVAWGWDLGKSQDYTCGSGLDEDNNVAAYFRFKRNWAETKEIIEIESCEYEGSPDCVIDSSGVGDPLVEDLQRRYPQVEGFKFTTTSKQQLMTLLMSRIHRGEVGIPANTEIIQELNDFTYTTTRNHVFYEAMTGSHDDTVMALAMALKAKGDTAGIGVY